MSNAVANVREDEVLVELRIMLEDLVLFHSLKADSKTIFNSKDLREAAVKHDKFRASFEIPVVLCECVSLTQSPHPTPGGVLIPGWGYQQIPPLVGTWQVWKKK